MLIVSDFDSLSNNLHNTMMCYTWKDSPSLGHTNAFVMKWWSTHIGENNYSKTE